MAPVIKIFVRILFLVSISRSVVFAANPTNCSFDDIIGDWTFIENVSSDYDVDCIGSNNKVNNHTTWKITLKADGVAIQDDWMRGFWTMVNSEGFDITIGFRNFFAYFDYTQEGDTIYSYCDSTLYGKSADVQLKQFSCFYGKQKKTSKQQTQSKYHSNSQKEAVLKKEYLDDLLREIDQTNPSWKTYAYEAYHDMSYDEFRNFAGGQRSWLPYTPSPKPNSGNWSSGNSSFDWRNVNGESFVSPPRHQRGCSSCYAFVSASMLEDRVRVYSKNKLQPIFSTQDIISCSELSDGCKGGFPYEAAGRYAWEYGLVEESCFPYQAKDTKCVKTECSRWRVAAYGYVGGQFGQCNEKAMIEALQHGPISALISINHDFYMYRSGVYRRHGGQLKMATINVPENHALVIVGYGVDPESGDKYWTAKNSWGEDWGEKGYIRVLRGVNEIGIESIAFQAFPIPRY